MIFRGLKPGSDTSTTLGLTAILRQATASFTSAPATFGIGAAGSQSSVLGRLRLKLSEDLNLSPAADGKGELYLRLLKQADSPGWELLVRITAQPQSKRKYRLVDVPGALECDGRLRHDATRYPA